jgi:tetratricopeptide (TPR) repeat protein
VVRQDPQGVIVTTAALGVVRAAQGRYEEAQELLVKALELARSSDQKVMELSPLTHLARLMRERGLDEEAAIYEARLAELSPSDLAASIA